MEVIEQAQFVAAVQKERIEWSTHSFRRMLERGISREGVKWVICNGEIIEKYPEDEPFPSALFFGMWQNQPLHAVVAHDASTQKLFVVTVYWPDEEHFESNFKIRRKK